MRLPDIPQVWKDAIAVDPTSAFSRKAIAVRERINLVNFNHDIVEAGRQKSLVGTRLLLMFRERVAAVPCSDCKASMRRLNEMTVAQIRSIRDEMILEIEKNATKAGVAFWARILAATDQAITGGMATRHMIGVWLDEVCEAEDAANAAVKPG
jgi:hypothetical protein